MRATDRVGSRRHAPREGANEASLFDTGGPGYFGAVPTSLSQTTTRVLSRAARASWPLLQRVNRAIERPSPHPSWAPSPLLKRRERSFPELGFPRETDSLCPRCVKEVRDEILTGRRDLRDLVDGKPGEIRAR